jgi:hypothetical protein
MLELAWDYWSEVAGDRISLIQKLNEFISTSSSAGPGKTCEAYLPVDARAS